MPSLREIWTKKLSDVLKQQLLANFASDYGEIRVQADGQVQSVGKINPHTLDILELGISDESRNLQQSALSYTYGIALREFENRDAYWQWRKAIGTKPLDAVERDNCRDLFARFAAASSAEKIKILERITRISFSNGTYGTSVNGKEVHGVAAYGLTAVRRQTALDSGLLDTLAPLLHDPAFEDATQRLLYFLMAFQPGEAYLKRVEPDVQKWILGGGQRPAPRRNSSYETLWFLNEYQSAWATDALIKLTETDYPGNYPWMITNALSSRDDPRTIPPLIALMEDCGVGEDATIGNALKRLTKAVPPQDADADWWRSWWRKNRRQFPAEIAALPIPPIHGTAFNLVAIRRKKSEIEIGDDPRKTYFLISSGLILAPEGAKVPPIKTDAHGKIIPTATVPLPAKSAPLVVAKEQRPGLLVVLIDNLTDIEAQKAYWQQVAARAFDGKYLIALASPPLWNVQQSPLWLTRRDAARTPNAKFTTEPFVRDIAADVAAKYPINSDRVFLCGVGAGEQAACACSLDAQTPFRGFLLLGGAFRSSLLPPLTNAKTRRYVLLHNPQDKTVPYFVATAAQQSLQKAGATVKLADYTAGRNRLLLTTTEPFADAIRWLETGGK